MPPDSETVPSARDPEPWIAQAAECAVSRAESAGGGYVLQHQHYAAALVETEAALRGTERAHGDARALHLMLQHLAARSRGDYAGAHQTWEALQAAVAQPTGCGVPRLLEVVGDQLRELNAAAKEPRHPLRIQDLLAALNMSIARRDTIALLARLGTLVDLLRETMHEQVGATCTPKTVRFEDAPPEVQERLRRTPSLLMPGTLTMKRSIANELRAFDVVVPYVDRPEPFRLATKFIKEVQQLTALRNRALHENQIVTYEQVVRTAATHRGGLEGLVRPLRHALHAVPGKPDTKLPTVEQLTDAALARCNALVAM